MENKCELCMERVADICYGGRQYVCWECYKTRIEPTSISKFASGLQLDDEEWDT